MDKFINLIKNYIFSRTWISVPIDREEEKLFNEIAHDSARIEQLNLMLKNGYIPTPSNLAHAGRLISFACFDKENFFLEMTNKMGKVLTNAFTTSTSEGGTKTTIKISTNTQKLQGRILSLGLRLGGGLLDNFFENTPKSQTNSEELKANLVELVSLMLKSIRKGHLIGMNYEKNPSMDYLKPDNSLEIDLNMVFCMASMGDNFEGYLKNMDMAARLEHVHRYREAQKALEPYSETVGGLLGVHDSEKLNAYEKGFFQNTKIIQPNDTNKNINGTDNGLTKIQEMVASIAMTNPEQVGALECLELEQKIIFIQTQYESHLKNNVEDRIFLQTLLSHDIPGLLTDSVQVSSPAMQKWAQIHGGNLSQNVKELIEQYKEIVNSMELKYTAINAQSTAKNLQAKSGYLRAKQRDMGLNSPNTANSAKAPKP